MIIQRKYGTATTIVFPMVKRGVVDLAVTADWTPATGDSKISKDEGATANTTNLPAIASGTSWKLALTATEMQAARITIQIVDSATKAVEDQFIIIETYGNASAQSPVDYDNATSLGLTNLDATVSSRSSHTAANVRTEMDANSTKLANLDATVSSRLASASYTAPDNTTISTINSKLGAFAGSGLNTVLGFLRALMRKDASLTPSDVGGTYDNTTDSQEAIKDNQLDAAISTRSSHTAANVRTEMDANSTKLDVAVSTRLASASYTAPPTAASIADSVWDEDRASHTGAGTFGERLQAIRNGTAQGSSNIQRITLDAGASSQNDFYIGLLIYLYAGTGAGQARHVFAYTGALREAIVTHNWIVQPDNTTKFIILPASATITNVLESVGYVAGDVNGVVQGGVAAPVDVDTTAIAEAVRSEMDDNSTKFGALMTYADDAEVRLASIMAKTNNLPASPAAVGSAMTLTAGERTSIAEALLKLDLSTVAGEASRSVLNALRALRNKFSVSGTTYTVTKEDDTTTAWTATLTTDPDADPITGSDPA